MEHSDRHPGSCVSSTGSPCHALIDHKQLCNSRADECKVDRKEGKQEIANIVRELREQNREQMSDVYDRLREQEKLMQNLVSQHKEESEKSASDRVKLEELHKTLMFAQGAKWAAWVIAVVLLTIIGWVVHYFTNQH